MFVLGKYNLITPEGQPELTQAFDLWPEAVRISLLQQAKLRKDESPILAFYQPNLSWFLLTTSRLIWQNPNEQTCELKLDDVETVGWSSGPEGAIKRDPNDPPDTFVYVNERGIQVKGHCGHHSPWLHIIDSNGKRFEAFLEKGNLKKTKDLIWRMSGGWKRAFERAEVSNHNSKQNDPELGSDAYKARRLAGNILHNGEAYSSWLFKALTPETQNYFLSKGPFDKDELLVYGFFEDKETWFLATSRRAIWARPGFRCRLSYDQISRIGMSEMERVDKKDFEAVQKVKVTSNWLYFEDMQGQRHEALLPNGSNLFAIWNSMLFMVKLEKIHPTK